MMNIFASLPFNNVVWNLFIIILQFAQWLCVPVH